MPIKQQEIVEVCKELLEAIGHHETKELQQRRWTTAYQLWKQLKEGGHPICDGLIADCGDDFVGKEAGSHVGPAQKIAQALGRHPDIETQYFDTKYVVIGGNIPSSDEDCGLFRLKKL